LGKLAPERYRKVMAETRLIQLGMMKEFGSKPKDLEVEVVYKGSGEEATGQAGRLPVELERERPAWFGRGLLERSQGNRPDNHTVRPTGTLG
jgi:hypothetical protein